jgi:predicted transcriptional regulator
MKSNHEMQVYKLLKEQPVTPGEVAHNLGISYKTAQRVLLDLAARKNDVGYKKSGRIYVFWHKSQLRNEGWRE